MTHTFDWSAGYASQRGPVFARNVVSTSHPLAAQAGLRMLHAGGNAVDAAIATAAVMTIVEPCSNGLGSDAFCILWDGRQLHGLNARQAQDLGTGLRYFGAFALTGKEINGDDRQVVLAIRNSHDKAFAAAVCIGNKVLCCENLCFASDIKLARRHTLNILADLPACWRMPWAAA
jgi:hypothetical protein